jgi:hypothetical protein
MLNDIAQQRKLLSDPLYTRAKKKNYFIVARI